MQHLLGTSLAARFNANWKEVYPILLEHTGDPTSCFLDRILVHPFALEVLLEVGMNPTLHSCHHIRQSCSQGYTEAVKLLLNDSRVDPAIIDNTCIVSAASLGHTEVVRLLLADPRVDPSARENSAIRQASNNGHAATVKLLLAHPRVDPSARSNESIVAACYHGHVEVAELLLSHPSVDPSVHDNMAIWNSIIYVPLFPRRISSEYMSHCAKNRLKIVKLLLADQRVDPTARNNEALMRACDAGQVNIVTLLISDIRVRRSWLKSLTSQGKYSAVIKFLLVSFRVDLLKLSRSSAEYAIGKIAYIADGTRDVRASGRVTQDDYTCLLHLNSSLTQHFGYVIADLSEKKVPEFRRLLSLVFRQLLNERIALHDRESLFTVHRRTLNYASAIPSDRCTRAIS